MTASDHIVARMPVYLHHARLANAPRTRFGLRAHAWCHIETTPRGPIGHIYIVPGSSWDYSRRVHEAEHILQAEGNAMHDGHTFHLCARAWHALRFFPERHASARAIACAKALTRDGEMGVF